MCFRFLQGSFLLVEISDRSRKEFLSTDIIREREHDNTKLKDNLKRLSILYQRLFMVEVF